jgi:glutathione peroxidase
MVPWHFKGLVNEMSYDENNLYKVGMSSIDGEPDFLSQFHGKVTLFVNIASKCGYQPKCSNFWSYARSLRQFKQLQIVHDEFKDRGFSVVGVPCNQFGKMEPCPNDEISSFIKKSYEFVNFPISEKIDVNGPNEHPLYSIIKGKEKRNKSDSMADNSDKAFAGRNVEGAAMARIPSNWEKFIVGRSGTVIARFNWQAMPLDKEPLTTGESWTIREAIDEILG